ncbi:unnamed protein product [Timema podura]|uniref:Uncharacterized protein n=1 Tax=Timema podura TaxID=61482 RepID=A0ABN7NHV8_TIMPD|nr:unnamed protein product [Timema podura]
MRKEDHSKHSSTILVSGKTDDHSSAMASSSCSGGNRNTLLCVWLFLLLAWTCVGIEARTLSESKRSTTQAELGATDYPDYQTGVRYDEYPFCTSVVMDIIEDLTNFFFSKAISSSLMFLSDFSQASGCFFNYTGPLLHQDSTNCLNSHTRDGSAHNQRPQPALVTNKQVASVHCARQQRATYVSNYISEETPPKGFQATLSPGSEDFDSATTDTHRDRNLFTGQGPKSMSAIPGTRAPEKKPVPALPCQLALGNLRKKTSSGTGWREELAPPSDRPITRKSGAQPPNSRILEPSFFQPQYCVSHHLCFSHCTFFFIFETDCPELPNGDFETVNDDPQDVFTSLDGLVCCLLFIVIHSAAVLQDVDVCSATRVALTQPVVHACLKGFAFPAL